MIWRCRTPALHSAPMADRPDVTVSRILAARRARAASAEAARSDADRLEADRQVAAALRVAVWIREGRDGDPPECQPWMLDLAREYAEVYPDALCEWARALTIEGLAISAAVCWTLAKVAEETTVH